ncbi:MAG: aminopeptidase P family protein, partial [Natrialbaceae archaeon]
MEPDLSALDAHLSAIGVDAYLIDAAGSDANQRYLSGFDAPDPFLTCYAP